MKEKLIGSVHDPEAIRGKSAYEIAVMHGFDGTEEEWLESLKDPMNSVAVEFNKAEAVRVAAEEQRVIAESGRAKAESERASAEAKRLESENTRATSESERVTNEEARVQAEAARAVVFEGWADGMENLHAFDSRINKHEKQITTLEAAVYGDLAQEVENSEVAYIKDVPASALPAAKVSMIGGMTRKCANLIDIPDATCSGTIAYNAISLGNFALAAGTYTLSVKYSHTGSLDGNISIRRYTNEHLKNITIPANTSGEVNGTFTLDDSTEGITVYLYSNITPTAGETSVSISKVMLNAGSTALPYEPFFEGLRSAKATEIDSMDVEGNVLGTLPIPEAVRAKDGYGEGINKDVNNHIRYEDDGSRTYTQMVKRLVLDGVTYGKKVDVTDIQAGGKSSYYAYFLQDTLPIISGSPVVWCGDVGVGTSTVLSVSVKNDILKLGDNPTAYEITAAINAHLNALYVAGKPVEIVYVPAEHTTEDISDILPSDNYIEVEGGGTLTFKNEYEYDVPSEVTFVTKEVSA